MKSTQQTPFALPLFLKDGSSRYIMDAEAKIVAEASWPSGLKFKEAVGRSAYIVNAVNLHDSLVRFALIVEQGLLSGNIRANPFMDRSDPEATEFPIVHLIDECRAVLKQATETNPTS